MNCDEVRDLVGAYVDAELAPDERAMMEQHVEGCRACGRLLDDTKTLTTLIGQVQRFEPPADLADTVRRRLDDAEVEPAGARGLLHRTTWSKVATHVGALALGAVMALLGMSYNAQNEWRVNALVETHVRLAFSEQFGAVISSDRHTVRPWFAGKIDYAPPVIDLRKHGFPLIAGRIGYMDGRAIAVLTYGRRLHRISLFVLPPGNLSAAGAPSVSIRGFNVLGWHGRRFVYNAVSDLNAKELASFRALMLAGLGAT